MSGGGAVLLCAIDDFIAYVSGALSLSPETVRAYAQHLEAYASWCEREGVDGLAPSLGDLRRYLGELRSARYAPQTVSARLSALRSLFRWLELEGAVESDPTAALSAPKVPRTLPVTLTAAQVAALFDAPDADSPDGLRDRCMLEFFYATGARISELAALDIRDVDLRERHVRLFGKGSKERIVPIHRRAVKAVADYLDRARPKLLKWGEPAGRSALFISSRGRAMDAAALRYRFRVLSRCAGIPSDISPHAMRHTFATDLLAGGADLRSVQELLGHASLSTTQIYTHLTPDRLKDAVHLAHPRG